MLSQAKQLEIYNRIKKRCPDLKDSHFEKDDLINTVFLQVVNSNYSDEAIDRAIANARFVRYKYAHPHYRTRNHTAEELADIRYDLLATEPEIEGTELHDAFLRALGKVLQDRPGLATMIEDAKAHQQTLY